MRAIYLWYLIIAFLSFGHDPIRRWLLPRLRLLRILPRPAISRDEAVAIAKGVWLKNGEVWHDVSLVVTEHLRTYDVRNVSYARGPSIPFAIIDAFTGEVLDTSHDVRMRRRKSTAYDEQGNDD
jgi:hypothetical protein